MFEFNTWFYTLIGLLTFSNLAVDAFFWQCLRDDATGYIPETDVIAANRSCVQKLTVPYAQYNVTWNDGTYSILGVRLDIDFNGDQLSTVGTGTVVAGTAGLQGLYVTIDFELRDYSNGCRNNGNGVSRTTGDVYLYIGRRSFLLDLFGLSRWRHCRGSATLDFSPPVTRQVVPISTSTLVATFDYCISSCLLIVPTITEPPTNPPTDSSTNPPTNTSTNPPTDTSMDPPTDDPPTDWND